MITSSIKRAKLEKFKSMLEETENERISNTKNNASTVIDFPSNE